MLSTSSANTSFWSMGATDVVQLMFWVTVGTVTALTYSHARRTILQPLRTEVFKAQLESMKSLLALLVGKGEVDLQSVFGFKQALQANTAKMFDDFAESQLGVEVLDKGKRPYSKDRCPGGIISLSRDAEVELANNLVDRGSGNARGSATLDWATYEYNNVRLPVDYLSAVRQFEHYLQDPLLPRECVALIESLLNEARHSITGLRRVLTNNAPRLQAADVDETFLERANLSWLHNQWKRAPLLPHSEAIINYARDYFASDQVGLPRATTWRKRLRASSTQGKAH